MGALENQLRENETFESLMDLYSKALDENRAQRSTLATTQAELAEVTAERDALRRASPEDLRAKGWAVAIHNDYRILMQPHTFWLMTRDGRAVKGEGPTDTTALDAIRGQVEGDDGG